MNPSTKPSTPPKSPKFRGRNKPGKIDPQEVSNLIPNYRQIPITLGEARFVITYLTNGRDYADAYMKAIAPTAKEKACTMGGAKFLRRPEIQKAIQVVTDAMLGERKMELEHKILDVLWHQAFFDPAKLIEVDGRPAFSTWDDVPLPLRYCIEDIETKFYGQHADRSWTRLKFVDRKQALKELATYVGMMKGVAAAVNLNLSPETEVLMKAIFSSAKDGKFVPGHPGELMKSARTIAAQSRDRQEATGRTVTDGNSGDGK